MRYAADRRRLDEGSTDCRTLLRSCLDRIDGHRSLNAFISVDPDGALDMATRIDERRVAGDVRAFDGLLLAVKDTISVRGRPLTCASRLLEGFTAEFDATVVSRLSELGAIVIGKTNCDEFGMGSSSEYSASGAVRNPLDETRSAGGSSGGSAAAVAAGLCHAALGSDTGGSVRQPAAFCAVTGFRPTWGRISRFGLTAFASSMDTIGFLAPDAALAARLAEAVEGQDGRDAMCTAPRSREALNFRQLRIGVPPMRTASAPSVGAALGTATERAAAAGATLIETDVPGLHDAVGVYHALSSVEAASNLARFDGMRFGRRAAGSDPGSFDNVVTQSRSEGFGAEVRRRILLGTWLSSRSRSADRLGEARRLRARTAVEFDDLFDRVDLLVTPTTDGAPFELGAFDDHPASMYEQDMWTIPASLAGCPAISIPVQPAVAAGQGARPGDGPEDAQPHVPRDPQNDPPDGWAPGIQIIGPRHSDQRVLAFAAMLHQRPA